MDSKVLKKNRAQSGFTLVEIAIVLVIIGLLLGGIIKGRELIANAKVKSLVEHAEELAAAVYAYQDKYGVYPGDDKKASTSLAGGVGGCAADDIVNGNGNGQVSEYLEAAQHLGCANLVKGSYNGTDEYIKTPYGGDVILIYETLHGFSGHGLRYYTMDPGLAQAFDKALDDGLYNKGSVRAPGAYTEARNVTYFF